MYRKTTTLLLALALLIAPSLGCGDLSKSKRKKRGRAVSYITAGKIDGTSIVTNAVSAKVSIFDNPTAVAPATAQAPALKGEVQLGDSPTSVAISPNGMEAWITRFVSSDIAIIDLQGGKMTGTVSTKSGGGLLGFLNWGLGPNAVAFSPDGKTAYAANLITANITIIDTATRTVTGSIGIRPAGLGTSDIAVTPNGKLAVASNLISGTVSIIDLVTKQVVQNVPVTGGPYAVAISPDSRNAYVASVFDGQVARIDLGTRQLASVVDSGLGTSDLAVSSDGVWTYATNFISGDVAVIDNRTNQVAQKILVGSNLVSVMNLVGLGSMAQNQSTQNLFSQFLKYLGSNGNGLTQILQAATATNTQQAPGQAASAGFGSQTILQGLLSAFLQWLGVSNTQTQQILGGTLQGVISMGIGAHGIAMVPGSDVAVVGNFITGNFNLIETGSRQVHFSRASAGFGASAVAVTSRR